MRVWSRIPFIVLAVMLVLSAAACGTGAASSGPNGETAEEFLAQVFTSSYDLTAATGSYSVSVQFDLGDVPASQQQMVQLLQSGFTASGTFAYSNEPKAADYTLTCTLMGQPMNLGIRLLENNCWFCYGNQWYAAPEELLQAMDRGAAAQPDTAEVEQLLTNLGLDPVTWFDDPQIAGAEVIDGVAVVHLTGSPDMAKMIGDVFALMQNEQFMALVGSSSGMDAGQPMPTAAELQEVRSMTADMFKDTTVDMWVGRDDYIPRKLVFSGQLAMPPEAASTGLEGMDLTATMSLQNINQVPLIERPFLPQPFEAFEKAMEQDTGLLGLLMQGLTGSGYGSSGLGYY
jgi:hypothetical protein